MHDTRAVIFALKEFCATSWSARGSGQAFELLRCLPRLRKITSGWSMGFLLTQFGLYAPAWAKHESEPIIDTPDETQCLAAFTELLPHQLILDS